ncbi:hypothetical protein Cni_G20841 [Canna indica]|uniref:Endonuclease/exonuclease/phosphatase domain-containing protein n=1 Tax=Canna indica TaxID=4628 RepID=A0AAQ3KUQ6_9LILI|nr:hypothetical protein Cni_G20841 [Canna indica]
MIVKQHNIDLIILQKTHLAQGDAECFLYKYKRGWDGDFVSSNGRSGGIMIFWRKNCKKVKCVFKDDQCMNILIKQCRGVPFLLFGIYASTNYMKRNHLWEIFKELNIENLPWIVVGDMNCIRDSSEKFGEKCKAEIKHMVEQNLNIKEGSYLLKYLGTYIAPKRLEEKYQMKLIQKAKGRVDTWASSQISQAGKCKDLTWNGKTIAECMSAIKDRRKISIGDGRGTKLRSDSWISTIPIDKWLTYMDV